jgi:hypothetical protein
MAVYDVSETAGGGPRTLKISLYEISPPRSAQEVVLTGRGIVVRKLVEKIVGRQVAGDAGGASNGTLEAFEIYSNDGVVITQVMGKSPCYDIRHSFDMMKRPDRQKLRALLVDVLAYRKVDKIRPRVTAGRDHTQKKYSRRLTLEY